MTDNTDYGKAASGRRFRLIALVVSCLVIFAAYQIPRRLAAMEEQRRFKGESVEKERARRSEREREAGRQLEAARNAPAPFADVTPENVIGVDIVGDTFHSTASEPLTVTDKKLRAKFVRSYRDAPPRKTFEGCCAPLDLIVFHVRRPDSKITRVWVDSFYGRTVRKEFGPQFGDTLRELGQSKADEFRDFLQRHKSEIESVKTYYSIPADENDRVIKTLIASGADIFAYDTPGNALPFEVRLKNGETREFTLMLARGRQWNPSGHIIL